VSKHHTACPWAARASPARGIAKKDIPMPLYQVSAHFKELKCYEFFKMLPKISLTIYYIKGNLTLAATKIMPQQSFTSVQNE
jgi:hypothetical protein